MPLRGKEGLSGHGTIADIALMAAFAPSLAVPRFPYKRQHPPKPVIACRWAPRQQSAHKRLLAGNPEWPDAGHWHLCRLPPNCPKP